MLLPAGDAKGQPVVQNDSTYLPFALGAGLTENKRVRVRFLLGPAGTGKTHRCLAEIRAALKAAPTGPPLILLAPKQATFQLERQLLSDAELPGYTRLQILSFDRLANFILAEWGQKQPQFLEEEGRIMVLRALLTKHNPELKRFRATAKLPGFAQQLSLQLRELQRHRVSPAKLLDAQTSTSEATPALSEKLHDLAEMLRLYQQWLQHQQLKDADALPDLAAEALQQESAEGRPPTGTEVGGLWLDGFAEMTPQELNLLAAFVPYCQQATLAFCLERQMSEDLSWLSTWSLVGQTFRHCFNYLNTLPEGTVTVETLERDQPHQRFSANPVLRHLEAHWARPVLWRGKGDPGESLRLAACANPEAEAILAAREILHHVRDGQGRYREVAVLLRQLDGYHELIRRVFTRYDIPFFIDRRESVAHHPLAELTRSALRVATFGWEHADWFGALKTGLVPGDEAEIDWLENEALARGWKGNFWRELVPPPKNEYDQETFDRAEKLRSRFTPPFVRLAQKLNPTPATGPELATALRQLWRELEIETQLEDWTQTASKDAPALVPGTVHGTVWEQMQSWLENITLAFAGEALPLREWLPVLEAGLANLTVGVIPPALDQVLVGTIDRSRNPDLQLTLLLGVNESVFPAVPSVSGLLTETDRAELERLNFHLNPRPRQQIGHERYYGYIACTRARQRLVLSFSQQDANGRTLNPSSFVNHLRRLFPTLAVEEFSPETPWAASEHASELLVPLLRERFAEQPLDTELRQVEAWPTPSALLQRLRQVNVDSIHASLLPALADKLYGPDLQTSVSRIEQFAACPFRFFVHSGMRGEERKLFDLDSRERGSFQHTLLEKFHGELKAENLRWRDITPENARHRVARIAAEILPNYRDGLLDADEQSRFDAQTLTRALQDLLAMLIEWMRQYEFDPEAVELRFGPKDKVPAWELPLDAERKLIFSGGIDRVDLHRLPGSDAALCVVIDYKSSQRTLDPVLLKHGIQLQLPAYLSVLRQMDARAVFGVERLIPMGVFYVNLRGKFSGGATRSEVLAEAEQNTRKAYQHTGRFDVGYLKQLDKRTGATVGDQFNYRLTTKGVMDKRSKEALEHTEFESLINSVEATLTRLGQEIFAGVTKVDPYQKGNKRACEYCEYAGICRIDPWTHQYRALKNE